ncbi:uncharacterized protein EHS24_007701 [Apiotrichum porosum]|uniref:Uncharacterized protein n=1 Tax=Apiotrichum porosum TaxID=105984 RepID=A0A427XV78_9TREE|nr:uncharacterized protein EHS24_007701 [Apiotrichum porosum]RSH82707.1 hypothetical protein EHS24_007701 [Apiotrichum porosum]
MVAQGFITPAPPANPTTQGRQEVPIAPVSNWAVGNVSSVLVFPSTLDPARLEAAFARAASFWPSVVGRYVKATVPGGPEFAISLTNSPIPFSTQVVDDEYPYPDRHVIQPDLGSFIPPLAGDYFVAGADAPLVTVRLSTLKNGNSVLGVNWAHILGDAAAFSRFLEDVSLLYNLPAADLDDDMPTLEPHVRLPPYSEQIGKDFKFDLLNPLPLEEVGKGYGDAVTSSQMFTVTLTPEEVKHITSLKTPGEHLSDNDLIAGWWVSVLERAGQRVEYVVQTINYRSFHKDHPAFPRNLSTLGANVAQMRQIPLPASSALGTNTPNSNRRALTVARTVRAGMNQLRNDPELMLQWLSNAAHQIGTAAHEGKSFCLVPPPGGVVVNSNLRYDWAIKFGQASANYHTDVSLARFLRVFQANPDANSDPYNPSPRGVELVFRVEQGPAVEAVTRVIAGDRRAWAEGGPVGGEDEEEEPKEPEVRAFGFGQNVHRPSYGGYGN